MCLGRGGDASPVFGCMCLGARGKYRPTFFFFLYRLQRNVSPRIWDFQSPTFSVGLVDLPFFLFML